MEIEELKAKLEYIVKGQGEAPADISRFKITGKGECFFHAITQCMDSESIDALTEKFLGEKKYITHDSTVIKKYEHERLLKEFGPSASREVRGGGIISQLVEEALKGKAVQEYDRIRTIESNYIHEINQVAVTQSFKFLDAASEITQIGDKRNFIDPPNLMLGPDRYS